MTEKEFDEHLERMIKTARLQGANYMFLSFLAGYFLNYIIGLFR
jgi:hypothetical protein